MKKFILGIMLLTFSQLTLAGMMCDPRYQGNTVVSTDCELGTTNNDSVTQVNADEMFGFDTWEHIWKDEEGGQVDPITLFSTDGDLLGGDFTIDWDLTAYSDIMFVLKDGHDDPDTYVGWLLSPGDLGIETYDFTSPFLNTTSGSLKQISHATFYGYDSGGGGGGGGNPVPEPAPLALMGLGLLMLRHQVNKRKA